MKLEVFLELFDCESSGSDRASFIKKYSVKIDGGLSFDTLVDIILPKINDNYCTVDVIKYFKKSFTNITNIGRAVDVLSDNYHKMEIIKALDGNTRYSKDDVLFLIKKFTKPLDCIKYFGKWFGCSNIITLIDLAGSDSEKIDIIKYFDANPNGEKIYMNDVYAYMEKMTKDSSRMDIFTFFFKSFSSENLHNAILTMKEHSYRYKLILAFNKDAVVSSLNSFKEKGIKQPYSMLPFLDNKYKKKWIEYILNDPVLSGCPVVECLDEFVEDSDATPSSLTFSTTSSRMRGTKEDDMRFSIFKKIMDSSSISTKQKDKFYNDPIKLMSLFSSNKYKFKALNMKIHNISKGEGFIPRVEYLQCFSGDDIHLYKAYLLLLKCSSSTSNTCPIGRRGSNGNERGNGSIFEEFIKILDLFPQAKKYDCAEEYNKKYPITLEEDMITVARHMENVNIANKFLSLSISSASLNLATSSESTERSGSTNGGSSRKEDTKDTREFMLSAAGYKQEDINMITSSTTSTPSNALEGSGEKDEELSASESESESEPEENDEFEIDDRGIAIIDVSTLDLADDFKGYCSFLGLDDGIIKYDTKRRRIVSKMNSCSIRIGNRDPIQEMKDEIDYKVSEMMKRKDARAARLAARQKMKVPHAWKDEKATDEKDECAICANNKRIVMLGCGHKPACARCTRAILIGKKECPICRAPIASVVRAYD